MITLAYKEDESESGAQRFPRTVTGSQLFSGSLERSICRIGGVGLFYHPIVPPRMVRLQPADGSRLECDTNHIAYAAKARELSELLLEVRERKPPEKNAPPFFGAAKRRECPEGVEL